MACGNRGEGSVSDGAGDEDLEGRGGVFSFDWKERMRCKNMSKRGFSDEG